MKRLWDISSSSCSYALELSHTDLMSSLQARDSDQSSWLTADVLLPHPFPCPPFGLQQSCYHRHQAPPSDKTENLKFTFIHCHYQLLSNRFLFLLSGQGVKELLYKDLLLLLSLSSGLLQPGSRLILTLHSDCS